MTNNDEQLNITEQRDCEQQADLNPTAECVCEQTDESLTEPKQTAAVSKKRKTPELVINIALWAAIAVLLVIVILRLFVFSTVEVDGLSMSPTYADKEVVYVNKTASPNRGDVVVFYKNEVDNKFTAQFASKEECAVGQPYEKLIKRVVAVEGDKIWVQRIASNGNDTVYELVIDTADGNRLFENYYVRDGEILNSERYYLHTVALSDLGNLENRTENDPLVISQGCFFALGDNRVNSKDSRVFGEFKLSQIFGVVLDK